MHPRVEQAKDVAERAQRSHPGRALTSFSERGGGLLANGIAYTGLFSLFAALALLFTSLVWLLGSNPTVLSAVSRAVDAQLPGLIAVDGQSGLIDMSQLQVQVTWSIAGLVALGALIWSAFAFVRALRRGLLAVTNRFDGDKIPFLRQLAGDVGTAALLGLGLLATTAIESGTLWLQGQLGSLGGFARVAATVGLWIVSIALTATFDGAVIYYLYRVVAHIEAPRRTIRLAAAGAGVAFGVVRSAGIGIVAGAASNPLLASVATIVIALAWINLLARIVLLGAAWAAADDEAPGDVDSPPAGGGTSG